MNDTHQFIEDAIAGGWKYGYGGYYATKPQTIRVMNEFWFEAKIQTTERDNKPFFAIKQERAQYILLDPSAWQAVGKTRGWVCKCFSCVDRGEAYPGHENRGWTDPWHRFIDHLADGKTVEEALAAIS